MREKVLILILTLVTFSTQQLRDQEKIDIQMTENLNLMMEKESSISLVLTNFSSNIQKVSKNLKAENKPKTLTDALDNFNNLILQIATLKSFKPYENISTCGDVNYKVTMMDFESRKMFAVINQLKQNTSLIYQRNSQLALQYNLNLHKTLTYFSTLERSVFMIITTTSTVLNEFWSYLNILAINIGKISIISSQLNAFKKKFCQCLSTVSWSGFNSTLEKNVEVIEGKLVNVQLALLKLTLSACDFTKKASIDTNNFYLNALQTTLEKIRTLSDYPKILWPNVANCNDLFNRIKFLLFKHSQYLTILPSANLNYSLIVSYSRALSSTSNKSNSTSLKSALDSVNKVELKLKEYISLLTYSTIKMAQMAGDISALGDTYCTCEINGGTTSVKPSQMTATSIMHPTTTTTSKARTTSTTTPTTTSTTAPTTTSTTTPTTTSNKTPTTSTTTPTTSTTSTTTPTTSTTTPTTSTTSTTKPTSSSTTQTSTTVMIPNTSVCNATTNITDSNGLITKKVCMISTGYAHAAAVAFCRSNGMQGLYAIVDVNHFNQLASFLTQKMMAYYGGINGCTLVIDGEQAANGTWFNYNPSASLLYGGAIPQTGSGGFILIGGTLGGFVTIAVSANTISWILCEYDVI